MFGLALFVPREVKRFERRAHQQGPSSTTASAKAKISSQGGEAAVVVGQPLPQFGTCRHYPHSHRQAYRHPGGSLHFLKLLPWLECEIRQHCVERIAACTACADDEAKRLSLITVWHVVAKLANLKRLREGLSKIALSISSDVDPHLSSLTPARGEI